MKFHLGDSGLKLKKLQHLKNLSVIRLLSHMTLIVVDRNLEGYEDGPRVHCKYQKNAIYTEIIFYTAGNTSDL